MLRYSPPYWGLRDYGVKGQLGLESTPEEYVAKVVEIFREVKRVLRDDGTLWLNLGDSYASSWACCRRSQMDLAPPTKEQRQRRIPRGKGRWGGGNNFVKVLKEKDLIGIPWRVALALQADGWYLRSDIIWAKPNPMPESVTDRPTKAHEYIFLMSKSQKYYYDADAIKEKLNYTNETRRPVGSKGAWKMDGREQGENGGGESYDGYPSRRNKRSVWTVNTKPFPQAHFAVFPEAIPEICIKAGCPAGGMVLDPFAGAGTTLKVARDLGCKAVGIELNEEYIEIIKSRIEQNVFDFEAKEER